MDEHPTADLEPLQYGTASSRRILAKKLGVLKLVNGRSKDTVKEALLVASKLQQELLQDLRRCSQYDLQTAHELQHMYIKCTEITLDLLRVLDAQGSVMIGKGEFLPNTKLNSISKWLKPKLKFGRTADFVWGSPVISMHPEVLKRRKLFEEAHHTWIRIEYDPSLSLAAKEEASFMIVSELKALVDPEALAHAAVPHLSSTSRIPPRCYLCLAYDEPLCDNCESKIHQQRMAIVCKKIGNSLLEPMVRIKADMANKSWSEIRKSSVSKSSTTEREAKLAHMRANLEFIRKHNHEKMQRMEQMKSQLAMLSQDNATAEPILRETKIRLDSIQADISSRRALLAQRKLALADARHVSLIDLHLIHAIALHGTENPAEIPGWPRVPRPRSGARGPPVSASPAPMLAASTIGGPQHPAQTPPKSQGNTPILTRPDWHFLHQSVSVEGTLLRTMTSSSTLIPFLVFMQQVAIWWTCALPYPIQPLPIPRIFNPSIVNPKLRQGAIPSKDGWHSIPSVGGADATPHEQQLHFMIAENARSLIRAIGTLPEEAIDLSNAWLNTFFWVFNIEYVRSYHNTSPLIESPHHRTRSNSKPSTAPSPVIPSTPSKDTPPITDSAILALQASQTKQSTNTIVIPPQDDPGWVSFLR